ncbi:glycerol-3-phosphate 1-O-acyltransferase PlsY [Geomicrobium sp. JCM 19055]|uniref:glycerol-3-phosphate 1-O-acyltransferase PlsY n=1 Tax=Geomicrobium sp. JCM 19055 TaxID=1460649 RepID=UPI00045EDD6C|nr:glycerol-3-phosphate 1-O-acyltransferase PlsY [Geomicrobium sp. JCM 19055]GAJ98729.1 acyl-phosphate:glycerol-3-phosphate O-acyltransferase PlsY [Geomicrobium sp. JCM 19055]
MDIILAGIIAYLIGSISFSYIFVKKIKKADIRKLGSGNAGATNTLRVLGKGPAILVLLLDALKGAVAVFIGFLAEMVFINTGLSFFEQYSGWTPALSGLLAILGHNYPIYYGFRGGKGVATTIGVIATLVFFPAIYVGIVAILAIVLTKYVSLGSLIFAFFTPFFVFLTMNHYDHPISYFFLTCVVGIMSIWRHRTNIQRLLSGTESKLGQKSK